MKRFLLLTLALTSTAFGQTTYLGEGSGFLGLPNKEERIINRCISLIDDEFNFKTNVYNDSYKYCKNREAAEDILDRKKELRTCLNKAGQVTRLSSDLLKYCLEDGFAKELEDQALQTCLTDTRKLGFPVNDHSRLEICRNKVTMALIKDESYLSCIQFLKQQKPQEPVKNRLKQCLDPNALEALKGTEFTSCRSKISALGFPAVSAINFCFEKNNQSEQRVKQVETCSKTLGSLLGPQAGIKFCLDFKESAKLQDSRVQSCFRETNRSLAPGFFDFTSEDSSKALGLLENVLKDCSNTKSSKASSVTLHGAYYFSPHHEFEKTLVGGLSGITYDAGKDLFYVVTDDSGQKGQSRFYTLKGFFTDGAQFMIKEKVMLGSSKMDAEGIQLLDNGKLVVSSETLRPGEKSLLKIFNPNGSLDDDISIPKKYNRETKQVEVVQNHGPIVIRNGKMDPPFPNAQYVTYVTQVVGGMQDNKGFESLGIPENDRNVIFTAPEAPLMQDLLPKQPIIRLMKISKNEKGKFSKIQEFAYQLQNTPDNGVSDILPLSNQELLVLERRYDPKSDRVMAAIFKVDLAGAQDVTSIASFKVEVQRGRAIPVVKKELVINLEDIVPQLPAGFRKLDNIEGMTLGPVLPNGSRSLVLVADNNFSEKQMNQILVLELPDNL